MKKSLCNLSNPIPKNHGTTLLVPATALEPMSGSERYTAAFRANSGPPLSKRQIVREVALCDPDDATHLGPIFVLAQRARASMFGQYSVLVAIWPDQVSAVVAFDPGQARPRAKQLVRAYRAARAGLLLAMSPTTTEEGELPC